MQCSARKEWEEELTSTQNLGVSVSVAAKKRYVEPIVKLQNFVAPEAKAYNVNKFSSVGSSGQKRKASAVSVDSEEDSYEEDFESLSRSQGAGLSMSKVSVKQKLHTAESYSQDNFEESKTVSIEDKITCFVCKAQFPKSQAHAHSSVCKKLKKKLTDDPKSRRKYSPIRETEDEHGAGNSSSDKYSSGRYEESSSSRV